MKFLSKALLFGLLAVVPVLAGCSAENVPPGHVAIKYSTWGEKRSIDSIPVEVGRITYNSITEDVRVYPVTDIRKKYGDESKDSATFTFNDAEGQVFGADVSITYSLPRADIPKIAKRYGIDKKPDDLAEGIIKDAVRDSISNIGERFSGRKVMSTQRTKFESEVQNLLSKTLKEKGFELKEFTFLGPFTPPANIQQAIDNSQLALENATKVENELRSTRAEAAKVTAQAEGAAKAAIVKARAEAEANRLLTRSITPELIKWRQAENQQKAIEKWDGQMPMVSGGGNTMLDISKVVPARE